MQSCLICDDHALVRDALATSVQMGWPDATVIERGDFPSGIASAGDGHDLILCDLGMPGAGPEQGIARMLSAAGDTPVLVITGNDDSALLLRLFNLGIAGFLPKSSRLPVIDAAIRLVLAGSRYLPPDLLALLDNNGPGRTTSALCNLTPRQIEVVQRMARGESNKEIARALDLAPATVKSYAASAFEALGATNRAEAVARAMAQGLIRTVDIDN